MARETNCRIAMGRTLFLELVGEIMGQWTRKTIGL
jgi:hypothetical protein